MDTAQRFAGLKDFLPEEAFEKVIEFFKIYPVRLKITHDRRSIRGDYRHPLPGRSLHRISINGTLNPYSFLITLLHEIAHLLAYVEFQNRIAPHGKEWKAIFKKVLSGFLYQNYFPPDIESAVLRSLGNLKATTCADAELNRALKRYDHRQTLQFVESLPPKSHFQTTDGRVFEKMEKMRTRYRCREVKSGQLYFIPGMAEVKPL
jgi:predicted SprT family Zn-dependent metalloprotease